MSEADRARDDSTPSAAVPPEQSGHLSTSGRAASAPPSAQHQGGTTHREINPAAAGLQRLAVPVPPMLEEAIGYPGDARLVGFYWSPGGDEACWDDARHGATGEWAPYLLFTRHEAVWPHLLGFDFGSSDAPAQHYLVLDRHDRILYAARAQGARSILWEQWPTLTAVERAALPTVGFDELTARLQAAIESVVAEEAQMSPAERRRRLDAFIAQQQQRAQELEVWLDGWLAERR